MQFQTKSAIWTNHCGIISLDTLITLHSLDIDIDQRIIVCKAVHANALFTPIAIVDMYAPASVKRRKHFFPPTTITTNVSC